MSSLLEPLDIERPSPLPLLFLFIGRMSMPLMLLVWTTPMVVRQSRLVRDVLALSSRRGWLVEGPRTAVVNPAVTAWRCKSPARSRGYPRPEWRGSHPASRPDHRGKHRRYERPLGSAPPRRPAGNQLVRDC